MSLRKHTNFGVAEHFCSGLPGGLNSTDHQDCHQKNNHELKHTMLQAVGKEIASGVWVGPEQQYRRFNNAQQYRKCSGREVTKTESS